MSDLKQIIQFEYLAYRTALVYRHLNIKVFLMLTIVGCYLFSDLFLQENTAAALTRVLTITILVAILLVGLFGNKKSKTIPFLYKALLVSGLIMMYAKCLIHINTALASTVTGTILVIFLVSFEVKADWKTTTLIFGIPTIVFLLILFLFFGINKEQFITLSNILPIIILGLFMNIIQERLRFNSFKQQFLLKREKDLTVIQAKELKERETLLKKANDTKDRFFSIIAHDLRGPYNSLLGYSKLLIEESYEHNNDEIKNISHLIFSSANHNFNLLNNLLQWSQLQQANISFTPKTIRFDDCITQVELLFNPTLCEKRIHLINETSDNLTLKADAYMLEAILRNIISNAVKYTPNGGQINITANQTDNETIIKITDTGIGIAANDKARLFQIDKPVKSRGTNDENGTGLGLIICKEFMDLHKGSLNVESEKEKGTCFTLTIPHLE